MEANERGPKGNGVHREGLTAISIRRQSGPDW